MEEFFGSMQPQMLRLLFASEESQAQGYNMILGMLRDTNAVSVDVCETWNETRDCLVSFAHNPESYAMLVLTALLKSFDIPCLL